MKEFVIVTRHPAFLELLRRRGLVPPNTPVVEHATPEDVRGRHVFGQLPLELAALAASLTTICIDVPQEMRGQELPLEWLLLHAGEARTYRVDETPTPQWEDEAAAEPELAPAYRPAITVTIDSAAIVVECPYYPPWRDAAQYLGGEYDRPRWRFEAATEREVRAALVQCFGTTGDDNPALVDVEYAVIESEGRRKELFALGRRLAWRARCDGQVTLGEGVQVVSGGFPRSGGHRNHPELEAWRGTVLLVRGVPEDLARAAEDEGQSRIIGATAPEEDHHED
jgi:hypothetical protein